MTSPPKFITFTGADEHTDVARMLALSSRYPIEWGILFSPQRQGAGRYPPMHWVEELRVRGHGLRFAAHLCGGYARDAIVGMLELGIDKRLHMFLAACERVQINTASPNLNIAGVAEWAAKNRLRVIFQTRTTFPDDPRVDWLFDASGGRGVTPHAWPSPGPTLESEKRMKGYAGGIRPETVAGIVKLIGSDCGDGCGADDNYYLDMESGVRDADDRFSLDKVEAVCVAVYGERA